MKRAALVKLGRAADTRSMQFSWKNLLRTSFAKTVEAAPLRRRASAGKIHRAAIDTGAGTEGTRARLTFEHYAKAYQRG